MTGPAADAEPVAIPRWLLCLLIVALVHGVAMLTFRDLHPPPLPAVAAPPAVLLDLAPPAAPPPAPAPAVQPPAPTPLPAPLQPPDPTPVAKPVEPTPPVPREAEPSPPPLPQPEAELPARPLHPHPVSTERPRHPHHEPPPPPQVPSAAPVEAPPVHQSTAVAPAVSAQASASWESAVSARLAQFKRYPLMAQRHGEEGVALVRFRVDHHGGVHGVALVQSSGHADLDQEAQDLVERAEPLPQPPADRTEDRIDLQLPIRFSLR